MTKEELTKKIAEKLKFPESEVRQVMDAFTEQVKSQLSQDGSIKIDGFGSFVLSKGSEE